MTERWREENRRRGEESRFPGQAEDREGLPSPARREQQRHAGRERRDACRHEKPGAKEGNGADMGKLILGRGGSGACNSADDHDKASADPDQGGADVNELEKGGKVHLNYPYVK